MKFVFTAAAMVFSVACSHAKPAPETSSAPPPAPTQAIVEPAPVPQPVAIPVQPPAPQLAVIGVYFEFDRAELGPDARAALEAFFEVARTLPARRIRIEGNCDERGSEEYNIALGQRRADAAKKYLVALGLAADRITAVSYGEERPQASGHDEEAWKQNRRDDLVPLTLDASGTVSADSR